MFDGKEPEGGASFAWKDDPVAARRHRQGIGDIIRALKADVVMLQEVENCAVVKALNRESLTDMGYKVYFVKGRDTFTGQDVALLARVPVDTVGRTDERARVGTTSSDYGVSKNLFARVQFDGLPVTLIGLHFLARPSDERRTPRREAQAAVIARLVAREHDKGRAVAVLGDFNDYDEWGDTNGHIPQTDVLHTVKRAGEGPEDDLRNVMGEVPQNQRYTNFWDRNSNENAEPNELSALDHILLSPQLYRRIRKVNFKHGKKEFSVTDHAPIIVTLTLGLS